MFRQLMLTTGLLLAADATTTALAPLTGVSLTSEAVAADFTGRIRTIRIKKKRVGSSFKVQIQDDGDATSADAATVRVEVCTTDGSCTDAVEIAQDDYAGTFASGIFSYDGAVVPEGSYKLQTELVGTDGKETGAVQYWELSAKGGEISVTPSTDVSEGPYISELSLTADECGNGQASAQVEGDGAESVGTVRWISLDGVLFDAGSASKCDEGTCVEGGLSEGQTTYNESKGELGSLGDKLAEIESADVTVTVTATDEKGGVIGTAKTEATAKYGDILIDGVPLQFD